MNESIYLGLSILEKAKLCYMDTGSFKVGDIYKDTAEDVETRFDTSN